MNNNISESAQTVDSIHTSATSENISMKTDTCLDSDKDSVNRDVRRNDCWVQEMINNVYQNESFLQQKIKVFETVIRITKYYNIPNEIFLHGAFLYNKYLERVSQEDKL